MTVEIVSADANHVGPIAAHMRKIDALEAAAFGHSPLEALQLGLMASRVAWTALVDGVPQVMLGVVTGSLLERTGRPWMLGTDAVRKHVRYIAAMGPVMVEAMQYGYDRLENVVAADNVAAVRMLLWLGFEIGPPSRMQGGVKFRQFSRVPADWERGAMCAIL